MAVSLSSTNTVLSLPFPDVTLARSPGASSQCSGRWILAPPPAARPALGWGQWVPLCASRHKCHKFLCALCYKLCSSLTVISFKVFSAVSFSLPWLYHTSSDTGRYSSPGSREERSLVTVMVYSHPNWAVEWCLLIAWSFFKWTLTSLNHKITEWVRLERTKVGLLGPTPRADGTGLCPYGSHVVFLQWERLHNFSGQPLWSFMDPSNIRSGCTWVSATDRLCYKMAALHSSLELQNPNPCWIYLSWVCTRAPCKGSCWDPSWEGYSNRL